MTVLHGLCYYLVPLCINYKAKEQHYQKTISQILELDIPVIMVKVNKSRLVPQPHRRYKRFVSTLAKILFHGSKALLNHRKQSAFQKGMKNYCLDRRILKVK